MLDVNAIRRRFPAFNEEFNGSPGIFFDGPGGTQVPQSVIDAMSDYMVRRNANVHGSFETSRRSDMVINNARQAAADLLGSERDEIIFGNNMTSLAFALSHALAPEFGPEDEIVVTRLDHDANVAPWARLAEDSGATLQWADIDSETCTLDMAHLRSLITPRTKLVAVGYASNGVGTINDVKTICAWAAESGAYSFVDAVQYAPHGLIDVKDLDCDFLACSAYKFFGPHVGLLYGKEKLLNRLRPYQVRPAGKYAPASWETGTKNHEGLAGVAAAIDYLSDIGRAYGQPAPNAGRRDLLTAAWTVISEYEQTLIDRLLSGLSTIPRVRLYGISDRFAWDRRVATVAIRKEGTTPGDLAKALGEANVFVWDGNFYALALTERLGVEQSGGLLRIGLVHYNTISEIDHCLSVIDDA